VFIILMENHNWSTIQANTNCPYINNVLLPNASYSGFMSTLPGIHPSEPNYIWLEAGTNFGILHDSTPAVDHQSTPNHLVTLLNRAGISWRTYQEDITGTDVPVVNRGSYAVRHNPFVYFDDVTSNAAYAISHIRPYAELAADLQNNNVARYNFITPNVCHDMHDLCGGISTRLNGDNWLAAEVPKILASTAYQDHGALFITWDEGSNDSDGPIGMIVLSPLAKRGGYTNSIHYTHSSTLRTMQEIFGVRPFLGDAANANDLGDLFSTTTGGGTNLPPASPARLAYSARFADGTFEFALVGITPGRTNVIEASSNLLTWTAINTNVPSSTNYVFVESRAGVFFPHRFYRALTR
jgi:hypothetical protein